MGFAKRPLILPLLDKTTVSIPVDPANGEAHYEPPQSGAGGTPQEPNAGSFSFKPAGLPTIRRLCMNAPGSGSRKQLAKQLSLRSVTASRLNCRKAVRTKSESIRSLKSSPSSGPAAISAIKSTSEQFEDRAWLAQVRRTLWLAARLRLIPVLAAAALPARGPVRATWRTLRLTFVAGDNVVTSDIIRGVVDPACAGRQWMLPPDRNCCRIAGILKSGNQKQLAKQLCLLAVMAAQLNCREANLNLINTDALSTGVV